MSETNTFVDHLGADLDEWLDSRLSPERHAEVERHVASCSECSELLRSLRMARDAVRDAGMDDDLPPGLEDGIRALLDHEDEQARNRIDSDRPNSGNGAATSSRPLSPGSVATARSSAPRWLLPLAAATLGLLGIAWWFVAEGDRIRAPQTTQTGIDPPRAEIQQAGSPWVDATFAAFAEVADSVSDPRSAAADFLVEGGEQLEAKWRTGEPGFPARFIDLSMMGHEVIAGGVRTLASRRATLAVYRADAGPIACWMFAADPSFEDDLPEALDRHQVGGFEFRVYERDGVTMVLWREGEVICVLTGRGEQSDIVALAHEKAMAPLSA